MVFHLVSISNPHHLDIILQEIQLVAELPGKARIPQDRHNDLTENDQRIPTFVLFVIIAIQRMEFKEL